MTFDEVLAQVQELLQREQRVSYRGLKRRFALDDDYLEDLKEELIGARRLATDEDGRFLVWTSNNSPESSVQSPKSEDHERTSTASTLDSTAERRQLTVMFCDLVGSTALSAQLDPEELREVVQAYQDTCTAMVQRYDGHVAQHLGDGLLVYFGYPQAHEDDAQRAVRTGLEILAGLQPLNARLQPAIRERLSHSIQVRIGIHTGLVVIGELGSSEKREILALGETPNLAARIQGQANPDEVVISAATSHLVEGLFACEDRGQPELKGVATPLTLYRVLNESEAQSRFEVAVGTGLTPLVGREEELGLLQRHWMQAKEGTGQVVLLSGEAGIGKSRLVQAVKEQVLAEGAIRIEFRCSPYHQNSALYPIIDHLHRLLRFQREEMPQAKLSKLQRALVAYRFPQADTLPLLAALLSLPEPEGVLPLTLSPQKQKQKTQEALVAWIMEEAQKAAVYCAWEDLHWADPSTLEVLTLFLEQIPTTRVFSVLTFRPEFTLPWSPRSYLSQLTLNRLGRPYVEDMVEKVTGGKSLPAEILQQIVIKTDGVPLFVEELTKMVLESGLVREEDGRYVRAHGGAPITPLAIPSTLQDSLMARLDRLAPVREIAQIGAVLGREFSYELLQVVSSMDEALLQQGLRQLVEAELIYQHGLPPQTHYLFKHALVQDTAYQSLLKSRRQQLHQQIARVLEAQFSDTKEIQPELLAHHYTEAGLIVQAIPYWQKAGERANQRSAYVEAVAHLTRGLELLTTLPDYPNRLQQELTLQVALGAALFAVKGYTAPEVEKTYNRARELCQQLGEIPQLFPVLWSLVVFHNIRSEFGTSRVLAEQLVRLAQRIQNPELLSSAYGSLGWTLYMIGEFPSARTLLEQGIAVYTPQQPPGKDDPRVICLRYASLTLWYLGYPDQGLQRSREAVALARRLSNPFRLASTLSPAAGLHLLRREGALAQALAEETVTLSTAQGFPFWVMWGMGVRGAALAEQGQVEEGIAQMQQSMSAFQTMGAESRAHFLAALAAAYAKVGRVEEGLDLLAEALASMDKTDGRVGEAELYWLKGELTLQKEFNVQGSTFNVENLQSPFRNPQSEAEECFLKAIEVAQKQQAKSWELRASTSLACLWQHQGKKTEAHKLLSEVYNWFTEGFDTRDLQDAKALLEELST